MSMPQSSPLLTVSRIKKKKKINRKYYHVMPTKTDDQTLHAMTQKVSFVKHRTWKELLLFVSILDKQVIIRKLKDNFTKDFYIMAIHEFGKKKQYLLPRNDLECLRISNLL